MGVGVGSEGGWIMVAREKKEVRGDGNEDKREKKELR